MSAEQSFEHWRANGRSFTHRGHEIFYRAGGADDARPALLLIHGFPTASWDWHRLWPALCETFPRVIAPDMIGFGYSAKPRDYSYSLHDQADLHEGLLRELGVRHYHILAHDIGDGVAQELLARHLEGVRPSRLLSICFLNGALLPETHRPRIIQKLLALPVGPLIAAVMTERSFGRPFRALFGPDTQPGPEELSEFWRLVSHNQGTRVLPKLIHYMDERRQFRDRWVGALERSDLPMRVIDGAVDPISGAHMVARYREVVPRPDAVVLEGIGHYPQIEAPARVLNAFFDLHARLEPATA